MIPSKQSDVIQRGNLTGERIAMTVDAAAMGHIMDVMTNLYKDPEMAVLREYTTNARDAHIEAGCASRPIEVTLPSPLAPFFKVQDYGVGLTVEDIRSIYSRYGTSTKRGTNDQTGMLGLGCKSALAYAQQFTLTSVKSGRRCQVAISRSDGGGGDMQIVDESSTTDPDGTLVTVPARRNEEFAAKAREFFSYWPKGSVLVNGQEPDRLQGLETTKDMVIMATSHQHYRARTGGNDVVVMGGVPYPANLNTGLPYDSYLVAFVPMGAVDPTPSREELRDTDVTKATIMNVSAEFAQAVTGVLQREIDKAKDPREAMRTMLTWQGKLPQSVRAHKYVWRGIAIPKSVKIDNPQWDPKKPHEERQYMPFVIAPFDSYVLSRHSRDDGVHCEAWDSTIWVLNYDRPTFTPGQKKKLSKWATDNAMSGRYFAMTPASKLPIMDWIDPARTVDWKVIEAIKLPRKVGVAQGYSGRIPGSYDVYTPDSGWKYGIPGDDVDSKNPLFWAEQANYTAETYVDILAAFYPKFSLVKLSANREDKFERLFPMVKRASEEVQRLWKAYKTGLSQDDRLWLTMKERGVLDRYRALDAAKIDDPDLKATIKLAKKDLTSLLEKRKLFRSFIGYTECESVFLKNPVLPLANYPLADNRHADSRRPGGMIEHHTNIYINAAYAAANRKGA